MSKVPTIPKDIFNDLKKLAVVAFNDQDSYELAKRQYDRAFEDHTSSTAAFAVALYDFALQYASRRDLITTKLDELSIQYKKTTSVYHHISRLAFDDVVKNTNEDVSRSVISRYASLIQQAHEKGVSLEDFRKMTATGVTRAMKRLGVLGQIKNSSVEAGMQIVTKFLPSEITLQNVAVPVGIKNGQSVELLARHENGKLVVYGLVPPEASNVDALLARLGKPVKATGPQLGDLFTDMMKTIKLVTSSSDKDAVGIYEPGKSTVSFTVSAQEGVAVLQAPSSHAIYDGKRLTLPIDVWAAIIETLVPLCGHLQSVNYSDKHLVVTTDEGAVPDLKQWYSRSGRPIRIGSASGSSLAIDVTPHVLSQKIMLPDEWKDTLVLTEGDLKPILSYKPSKKFVSFAMTLPIRLSASAKAVDGRANLQRKSHRRLQAAAKKMLRWSKTISLERAKGYVRLSAKIESGVQYSVIAAAE